MDEIKENLSDENIAFIVNFDQDEPVGETSELPCFGETIDYKPATIAWPDTTLLHDMCQQNALKPADDFTMSYDKIVVANSKSTVRNLNEALPNHKSQRSNKDKSKHLKIEALNS